MDADELSRALLSLVSARRLGDVLQETVDTAAGLVGASEATLAVLDARDRVVELVRLGGAPPLGDGAHVLDDGVPLVRLQELWTGDRPATDHPGGAGAYAFGVPVRSRRGFRGYIHVARGPADGAFTEEDAALLDSFAAIAGAVIDKAQLYEDGRQRELWVALQGEIATSLLAGDDTDQVLDAVARGARELTDADSSTVLLYDGRSSFTVHAADGHGVRHLVGASVAAEKTISGQIIESGQPVTLTDTLLAEAPNEPLLLLGGIGRALFVPLVTNGGTTGTLAVGRLTGRPPLTQTDFWLLESFASQVSVALEYGRARSELERLAVVEDQERIARDLHDTVIQQLFATGLSLQATAQRTADSTTAERIQLSVDTLDTVIRDIRAAVFALRSPAQANSGVRAALRNIAAQAFESSDVTVEMQFDGPVDTAVVDEVGQHVIATVREALSNVNRHAQASRVQVSLDVGSETVLRVIDDGVGMGPRGKPLSGLRNLKARAERLGGTMVVTTPSSGGTALEWRVPCQPPDRSR